MCVNIHEVPFERIHQFFHDGVVWQRACHI